MERLPDTVLFDVDGTLAHTLPGWIEASTIAASEHGITLTDADKSKICAEPFARILHASEAAPAATVIDSILAYRERILRDVLHEYTEWMDGADELMESLRSRRIGIVTNAHKAAFDVIDRKLGISRHVGHVVTWDDVAPHGKPKPDPLYLACRKFDIRPPETVYVADTDSDRMASEAAGMPFIHVEGTQTLQKPPSARSVTSMRQLLEML